MADWFLRALLLVPFAVVLWYALRPRYPVDIRVVEGHAHVEKGKVTRAFLDYVTELCQENGIERGRIRGVWRQGRISLRFSRQFPAGSQQMLRNEWQSEF